MIIRDQRFQISSLIKVGITEVLTFSHAIKGDDKWAPFFSFIQDGVKGLVKDLDPLITLFKTLMLFIDLSDLHFEWSLL